MADQTMDVRIPHNMLDRTEIMFDGVLNIGTGISVQEVINAFCDFMDGESKHDLIANYGLTDEQADRRVSIYNDLKGLWKDEGGAYILHAYRNAKLAARK